MTIIEELQKELKTIEGKISRRRAKILLAKKKIKILTEQNNRCYNLATETDIVLAKADISNLEMEITALEYTKDNDIVPYLKLALEEERKNRQSQPGEEY